MQSKKKLYVIMPIASDPQSSNKRKIIEEVAGLAGVDVSFPMDQLRMAGPREALSSTLAELRDSDLVMADLSLERPSCYYELGLAEAVGASVALLAKTSTGIHQSAARHEVHSYATLEQYREVVASLVSEVIA